MTKKRYFINFAIILILATVTGVFVGNWYNQNNLVIEAVTVSEETVRGDDLSKALKKASGKSPADLSATENFILAEYYLNQKQSVKKSVTGAIVAAGVNQTLSSEKIKQNGQIYGTKVSASSLIKVADATRYTIGGNEINIYSGEVTSSTTANFSAKPSSTLTLDEYTKKFGSAPDRFIAYVVGSKTVLSSTPVVKNENGYYSSTLTLDTTYSVMNYAYEIKSTAGSSSLPYFKSIKLTYEIDENWNLISISYQENYEVKMPVLGFTECNGNLKETYTYDGVTLPN